MLLQERVESLIEEVDEMMGTSLLTEEEETKPNENTDMAHQPIRE